MIASYLRAKAQKLGIKAFKFALKHSVVELAEASAPYTLGDLNTITQQRNAGISQADLVAWVRHAFLLNTRPTGSQPRSSSIENAISTSPKRCSPALQCTSTHETVRTTAVPGQPSMDSLSPPSLSHATSQRKVPWRSSRLIMANRKLGGGDRYPRGIC